MDTHRRGTEFRNQTERILRILGKVFHPPTVTEFLSGEREGVEPGSEQDAMDKELVRGEVAQGIIAKLCDDLAPRLKNVALHIASTATKIAEKITSPEVLKRGLEFTGVAANLIREYGDAILPATRYALMLITMIVKFVISVFDQILRASVPIGSRLIAYLLIKPLAPIVAAEIGVAAPVLAPVIAAGGLFASDVKIKQEIAALSNTDRERFLEQLYTNPVLLFKYMDKYGDGGVHVGPMAQGYDFPVVRQNGEIKVISTQDMLGLLVIGIQDLNQRIQEQDEVTNVLGDTALANDKWANQMAHDVATLQRHVEELASAVNILSRNSHKVQQLADNVRDLDLSVHAIDMRTQYIDQR